MAFSFNWAGLNVPSVNYVNSMDPEYGKNLGLAARGFKNRMAASDFAKKIDAYRQAQNAKAGTNSNRIKEIEAEIAELNRQNQEIMATPDQQEVQPQGESSAIADLVQSIENAPRISGEEYDAAMFEPSIANKDEIIEMQRRVGTNPDGLWGRKSQAAFDKKYGDMLKHFVLEFGGY
jgi:murein L,D-transpeptidase YcbB/YkuD